MDKTLRPLEFELGNVVMLEVLPIKGVPRFGKKGKLAPRYIGSLRFLNRLATMCIVWGDKICYQVFMMCSILHNTSEMRTR